MTPVFIAARLCQLLALIDQLLDNPIQRQFEFQSIVAMGEVRLTKFGLDQLAGKLDRIFPCWRQNGIDTACTDP